MLHLLALIRLSDAKSARLSLTEDQEFDVDDLQNTRSGRTSDQEGRSMLLEIRQVS